MPNPCIHQRTEMIARKGGVDYVRCLDCGWVFEAEDLEPVSTYAAPAGEDEDNRE